MNRTPLIIAVSVLALTSLAGCQKETDTTAPDVAAKSTTTAASNTTPAIDADAANSALMAAAEPFEALTEQAQSATPQQLDELIADTKRARQEVDTNLPAAAQWELDKIVRRIEVARKQDNRAAIALASVEGYRTLVESAGSSGGVPVEVSLLDYAGFRFAANIDSKTPDWTDAAQALDVADTKWKALKARVADRALRDDFTQSLSAMRDALTAKDVSAARAAATSELDLVDELERFFANSGAKG